MATSSHHEPFRHYLREWREERKMLQEELAEAVGLTKSAISRYETGERKIHLDLQFRLMVALRIVPAQFFSPPGSPSLDALIGNATPEQRRLAVNLVKAIVDDGGSEK
jgi:transcriptional regulator with XRE-family HTH domain